MDRGLQNLEAMFLKADKIDLDEGCLAYERYNLVMQGIADKYRFALDKVVACFVSLSPNSSYNANLRSTVSVLDGINNGVPIDNITVATYGHCKLRAYQYAKGAKWFEAETKGPKILSFYHNILDPRDIRWVTVDGHMSCIWQGRDMTMREAPVSDTMYRRVKHDITALAFKHFLRPCQMQAVLWFTRKRTARVIYDPQMQLFADRTDVWNTYQHPDTIVPYPPKV